VIGTKWFPLIEITVVIFLVTLAGFTLFLNIALWTFGITEIGMYV